MLNHLKSYLFIIITILGVLVISSCENPNEENYQAGKFSNKFLELGDDSDQSYKSLRTVRQSDESLEVFITGWGIEETGLFLHHKVIDSTLYLHIMGECGTVSSYTYVKATMNYLITPEAEDTLNCIIHYSGTDTLVIIKN